MATSASAHVKTLTNVGDPLLNQNGTPIVGTKITFQLVRFGGNKPTSCVDALSGEVITKTPSTVVTDANGEFTTTLWPNGRGDSATAYYVTFSKNVDPFFILIDESLNNTLVVAKAAYAVGTGAANIDALTAAFNAATNSFTSNIYHEYTPTVTRVSGNSSSTCVVSFASYNKIGSFIILKIHYTSTCVALSYPDSAAEYWNVTLPFTYGDTVSGGGFVGGGLRLYITDARTTTVVATYLTSQIESPTPAEVVTFENALVAQQIADRTNTALSYSSPPAASAFPVVVGNTLSQISFEELTAHSAPANAIYAERYATLALADAAAFAAGKQLIISTQWDVVPATLSADIKIVAGGKINNSGMVTFTGNFTGCNGCFIGSGLVTGLRYIDVTWFGAIGNNSADDQPSIQKAFHSIEGTGKGHVHFPSGYYKLLTTSDPWQALSLDFTVTQNTGLIKITGDNAILIHACDPSLITFNIAGAIGAYVQNVEIVGLTLLGTRTPSDDDTFIAANGLLYLSYVENVNVHNCVFKNNNGIGIDGRVRNANIHHNQFTDSNGGVQLTGAVNTTINNNIFKCNFKCDDQIAISGSVTLPSYSIVISNNIIDKSYTGLKGVGGTGRGWARGILIGYSTTDYVTDVIISGNTIKNNNSTDVTDRSFAEGLGAIQVQNYGNHVNRLTITNNTIDNCRWGIWVTEYANDIIIRGNIITNIEQHAILLASASIILKGSSANISGNTIGHFGRIAYEGSGIKVTAIDDVIIADNVLTDFYEIDTIISVGMNGSAYVNNITISGNKIRSNNVPVTATARQPIMVTRGQITDISSNTVSYKSDNSVVISNADITALLNCSSNILENFTGTNAVLYVAVSQPTTSLGNLQRKFGEVWSGRNIGSKFPNNSNNSERCYIKETMSAAPTTGTWVVGDRVQNATPAVGQPKGWICTVSGTPGTWVSEGNL